MEPDLWSHSAALSIAFVTGPEATGPPPASLALACLADVTSIGPPGPEIPGVRQIPVTHDPAPSQHSAWSQRHWWSIGVLQTLRRAYPQRGPDIIEFEDRGGAGFVTLQARLTLDPLLSDTTICVRCSGTLEMTQILEGAAPADLEARTDHDLERYVLRHADRLLHTGASVMHAYRSFYESQRLAPDVRLVPARRLLAGAVDPPDDGALRLLFLDSLSRRCGVVELISAVQGLDRDDWRLTLCGADTPTGPLGRSMREVLELQLNGDARVSFREPVPRDALASLVAEHHLAVMPGVFGADPSTALDVLACNRPILGVASGAVGDLIDVQSGWLCAPGDERALRTAIGDLLDRRHGNPKELILAGGSRERARELCDPSVAISGYGDLARSNGDVAAHHQDPLVSVVVPYHGLSEYVEETLDSIFASTYQPLEVILVNDGSFEPQDDLLLDLAERPGLRVVHQVNAGPSAARNLGFALAQGKYLLPVDADDIVAPEFIARCVEVLEAHPEHAFVTCWSRHMDSSGEPIEDSFLFLGNEPRIVLEQNVAGTPAALLRREVVDRGNAYTPDVVTHEDWSVYRTMHQRGLYGHVIPEFLLRYRVRPGSLTRSILLPHMARLESEVRARGRQEEVSWAPVSS